MIKSRHDNIVPCHAISHAGGHLILLIGTKSKHKVDTRLFSTHGVWGISEAAFGNNGKTKTGIILDGGIDHSVFV
jgi:hypothetical protein